MKKSILIFLSAVVVLTIYFISRETVFSDKIVIKDRVFRVETAFTDEQRTRGLSRRESLCQNCSMLFIFEKPGNYSFWMKDMRFSLDIIWIMDNKIVHIAKNISPDFKGSIRPAESANRVIEINAGLADSYGFAVGDEVKF